MPITKHFERPVFIQYATIELQRITNRQISPRAFPSVTHAQVVNDGLLIPLDGGDALGQK